MRSVKLIAIAVVRAENRFLVGLRPAGVPLAGYWEFPGGKVEPGESPEAAAIRECQEETGVSVAIAGEYESVEFDYSHDRVQLRFFDCIPIDPASCPAPPFRWVETNVLATLPFPPANAPLIARLTNPDASPLKRSSRDADSSDQSAPDTTHSTPTH